MIDLINLTKILGSPEKVQSVLSEISKSSGNGESFEKILQKVVDELSKADTSESAQNENSAVAKKIALSQQIVKNENQVGSLGEENKVNKKEILQTTVTGQSERLIKETTAGDSKTQEVKSDDGKELFEQVLNKPREDKDVKNDIYEPVSKNNESGLSDTTTLKEEKLIDASEEKENVSRVKEKFLTEFTPEAPRDGKREIIVKEKVKPISSNTTRDDEQRIAVANVTEKAQSTYTRENKIVGDNAGVAYSDSTIKTTHYVVENVKIASEQSSETKTNSSKTVQSFENKISESQDVLTARVFSQRAGDKKAQNFSQNVFGTEYAVESDPQMTESRTTVKKTEEIDEINNSKQKLQTSNRENKSVGRIGSLSGVGNTSGLEEKAQLIQLSATEFSKALQRQNSTNGVVSNVNVEKTNVLHEINVRNPRTSENAAVVNGLSTSHTNVLNKSNMEKIDKVISQEKIQTSQRVVPFVANSNANESKQNDAERKSDGNILPIIGSIRLIASEKLNQIVNFQSKDEDIGKDNAIDSKASKISNQQISLAAELVKSAAMENPKVVSNQPNVQVNESIKDKNNVQLAEKSNIPDITQPEISSDVVKPARNDIFQNTNSQQEKYDAKAFRNEAGEVSKNKLEIKSFEVEYRVKDEPKKGEIQEKPNISNKFLERLAEMTYKASETKFEQTYQASSRFELAERLQYARNLEEIYQKIREFGFSGKLEENVRMKLYPEQLGNIDVELKKEGRSITIVFVAENEKSKELLEKNIGVLRERLTTLDFDVKNLEVRMKEENNYYEESRHQHNQQQREHNQEGNRKRAFNKEVMEDDDERERDV